MIYEDYTGPKLNIEAVSKLSGSLTYSATYIGRLYGLTVHEIILSLILAVEDTTSFTQEIGMMTAEELNDLTAKAKQMAEERLQKDRDSGLVDRARKEQEQINLETKNDKTTEN